MKLPGKARRSMILDAAIRVANRDGLYHATREAVANECAATTTARTIRIYFKTNTALWDAVCADARFTGDDMGYRGQ